MVPHVVARKTHQRLLKFSFVTPKRLLQQYLPEAGIAGGPVSCAIAYKSPQWPPSQILRQSVSCMKTGADEFVLATNARRTHELTAQRIGAKAPQDGPRR